MRRAVGLVPGLLLFLLGARTIRADNTWEFSVQVSAAVQTEPPQITLTWPQDTYTLPNSYTVFRKAAGAPAWGKGIRLPATATNYTDNQVAVGQPYEFQIIKQTPQYTGYGYLYAGINVPAVERRGKLLLVIDNSVAGSLSRELDRLQQDLAGDGWMVSRLAVNREDSVPKVKKLIKAEYAADPANLKALLLFGHIPVPYSGDIVPDGHMPDHQGAWPCDGFYGDMEGMWTDRSVNNTGAAEARTRNVPGDGKYDQSTFPAPIKLMVGRVDLANLPGRLTWGGPATFPDEIELLRNYLNKNHKFRHKQFDLPRRAFVGDYFGYRNGEAFAASGWRNFAAFFSSTNVANLPEQGTWMPTLSTNPCLVAYGCGAGSYTSIGGLGNSDVYHDGITTELMANDPKTVFALLFGSWLGDWDSEDNILRSVLALPSYGLAAACSGRPHWFMQHMALGEPIGVSARLTQNNAPNGLYQSQMNSCAGQIHIALMGDPTLRLHVVAPPFDVQATTHASGLALTWMPAPDSVTGYYVYSTTNLTEAFTRLTPEPVAVPQFIDPAPRPGTSYMVRAVKLETSASGSYYNLSQGAFFNPETQNLPTLTDSGSISTNIPNARPVSWMDDALPAGAISGSDDGGTWRWVGENPSPASGKLAAQSNLGEGLHQQYFSWASPELTVNHGDSLFAHVYLDSSHPPNQLMLQWNDGTWEHRAYWGANKIDYGEDGTVSRHYAGPLPPPGRWVRLQVPASRVGLEGRPIRGMAFTLFGGRATWDNVGRLGSASEITNL